MGRKNDGKGRKRKSPHFCSSKVQSSPPAKRRTSLNITRRRNSDEPRDMQPDLQQWLEKSSSDQERPQLPPPTIKSTITVEAEINQHPVEATLDVDDDDDNNRDAIDIALDIAKDASTVKNDIRRIEKIILNTQNTQARENRTLLLLLNSIKKNMDKIDKKSDTLEEKINNLSAKINIQEQRLSRATQNIELLFKSMSNLEKQHSTSSSDTNTNNNVINLVDNIRDENSVVISNLPESEDFDSDVNALIWTGLCLNVQTTNVNKIETKNGKLKLKVELRTLKEKIEVIKNKRQLRKTNEYCNVFIESFKTRTEIIMEQNFKTLFKAMPGDMYNMSSSGRVRAHRGHN